MVSFWKFKRRLAQFNTGSNDRSYWEERWSQQNLQSWLNAYKTGKLDEFESIFLRFLPSDLPVLEAGCGRGQLVMALSARGYQVEGIDYASETIARLQEVAPELSWRVGDIYHLDVPDETYGGYISIGVFEHNPDGPLEGLREARRVLHPRGVAFITVPYLNRKRRRQRQQVPVADKGVLPDSSRFYQFYFSRSEFEACLSEAGLKVVEVYPYGVYSGLTRDFAMGRWLHDRGFFFWRIHRRITRWCREAPAWARWRWAHMLLFVCRRSDGVLAA